MGVRRTLLAAFRGSRSLPSDGNGPRESRQVGIAEVQVVAHSAIADLFGVGLRIQNLAAQAPESMDADLDEITDQIDRVISQLREFAFGGRLPPS
jgi:hypothetical protein